MKRMFIAVLVALTLMLGTLPAIAGTTSSRVDREWKPTGRVTLVMIPARARSSE